MLVYGRDEDIAAWISEQLNLGVGFLPPYTCIGVVRDGTLVAGCLFNSFMLPDIQWTLATTTPRWASKQVISRLLAYPFLELGCGRLSAMTRAGNAPARMFMDRLGFRQEGYHPGLYLDDDGVSYGLMRDDAAPWLKGFTDEQSTAETRRA